MMRVTHDNLPQAVSAIYDMVENLELLIKKTGETDPSSPDQWMDIDQFRNYIPQRWSRATVYSKTAKNEFPFHKRGKKLMFLKSEVDNWLRQGKRKSFSEVRAEAEKLIESKT